VQTIDDALNRLRASAFRAGFDLEEKDGAYIREKGMNAIRRHAQDFVRRRLAPAVIPNDGRQTPTRGHPVFIAQHACACCCRGCLSKWYHVPKGTELTECQQEQIVNLLMAWIEHRMRDKSGRQ
jgi:exodeoxyribonuclease V alpha subunit